ncbi:MAG: tRNA (N6-threonylcarbamoyladenosine(37)-N6)-methyltransferase TrmO [Clostridia bacterium]|nr:tRNA (N6-threonylcarbamoyladenosine(37)-N6)-methyltransferase TrmO [Clostridia bacterium]
MEVIARIRTDFPTKFGIPRQSGLAPELKATIEFEGEYRNPDALRGIEQFSHIWLLWGFSIPDRRWTATVRPPRLGGNARLGVFATRSPYRPNPIGLSCVKLDNVILDQARGPLLEVSGADLMDMTPIYDIKPYIKYTDCRPDASDGFAGERLGYSLEVVFARQYLEKIPVDKREALIEVLRQDPRPAYQDDANRVYGFEYAGFDIRFTVEGQTLTVREVVRLQ